MQFDRKGFTEPIGVCQAYQMKLNDIRRRSNPLLQNHFKMLAAIDFKCNMLKDGRRAPAHRICFPTVVAAAEAPEPPEAEGALDPEASAYFAAAFGCNGSDEILMATKMCLGWQCSYRTKEPEKRVFPSGALVGQKPASAMLMFFFCSLA